MLIQHVQMQLRFLCFVTVLSSVLCKQESVHLKRSVQKIIIQRGAEQLSELISFWNLSGDRKTLLNMVLNLLN